MVKLLRGSKRGRSPFFCQKTPRRSKEFTANSSFFIVLYAGAGVPCSGTQQVLQAKRPLRKHRMRVVYYPRASDTI